MTNLVVNMKSNWQTKKLGEVILENKKSKIQAKSALTTGNFIFFKSGEKTLFFNSYLCEKENIYLATGGKAVIKYFDGKAAYSTDTYSIHGNSLVVTKFLFYYLLQNLSLIEKKMFLGAGIRHLQKNDLKNLDVPLPSLSEQRRILKILDKVFREIEKAKENTEKNLQNAKDLFESYSQNIFIKHGDAWDEKEFGELIELLTDYHANGSYKHLKANVELKKIEDYAWMVRSTDFENKFENEKRYITKKGYDFLKKSKIFGNEIIMSKIGNAGKVYLMPKINRPCSLAMNLFLIRLNEKKCLSEYIYLYLNSKNGQRQIESRLLGTTTKTITKDNVKNIRIPFPPINEQKSIVKKLDLLSEKTKRLEEIYTKKLADLGELKKSILAKAFRGEL